MEPRQTSPTGLLILLSTAAFLTMLSGLMLGPLLVPLAHEFQRPQSAIVGVPLVAYLVGAGGMFWYMLAVNAMQQMVFWSMVTYPAAYLLQTYHLQAEATALPPALVGGGVIVGAFLGGRMADQRRRLTWFALACWGSGPLAALVFSAQVSPWATVGLASGVACLTCMSSAVTPIVLLERAGRSRTTARGLFSLSNQLGSVGGPRAAACLPPWREDRARQLDARQLYGAGLPL